MEFLKEQQTAGTHASCLTAEIDTRRVKEEKAEHRYLRACLRCLCNKLEIELAPKKKKMRRIFTLLKDVSRCEGD